jgi:hypothetical protein
MGLQLDTRRFLADAADEDLGGPEKSNFVQLGFAMK